MNNLLSEYMKIVREETYDREFNKVIDTYVETGRLSPEQYASCTPFQKIVIQCLKRSFKRITNKNNEHIREVS